MEATHKTTVYLKHQISITHPEIGSGKVTMMINPESNQPVRSVKFQDEHGYFKCDFDGKREKCEGSHPKMLGLLVMVASFAATSREDIVKKGMTTSAGNREGITIHNNTSDGSSVTV